MSNKISIFIAMTLSALLLGSVSPAVAAEGPVRVIRGHGLEACPRNSLCLYEDVDYNGSGNGRIWVVTGSVHSLSEYGGNDETSSMYMHTPENWRADAHENRSGMGSGDWVWMYGGKKLPNLRSVNIHQSARDTHYGPFNDVITSVSWAGGEA